MTRSKKRSTPSKAISITDDAIIKILYDAARTDLRCFTTATFPQYDWNWHHVYLCKKLSEFAHGRIKKMMFFMPPQHGKSELVSRRFPAFLLGLNPKYKIVGCSYSADLARKFNRNVQRIIDDRIYQHIFPETFLSGKRTIYTSTGRWLRNVDEFEIVGKGGGYKSVGVMGSLTGNTVDVGIIDDPIKDAMEAYSERIRDNIFEWYTNVFLTRLNNNSRILLTMTRWHEDDLAGRILSSENDWEVVNFRAIREDDINPDDPRKRGEALWESRHSADRISDIKRMNIAAYNALYQQRPSQQDGNIIKPDEWFDIVDDNYSTYVSHFMVDTSYGGSKADPSAFLAYIKTNEGIIVKRCVSERLEFHDLCRYIVEFVTANGYDNRSRIGIEPKASGKSVVQELRRQTNLNVFETPPPSESKVTRARTLAPFMSSGRIKVIDGSWVSEFFDELRSFPNAAHDDKVDVLLMAIDDVQVLGSTVLWTGLFQ